MDALTEQLFIPLAIMNMANRTCVTGVFEQSLTASKWSAVSRRLLTLKTLQSADDLFASFNERVYCRFHRKEQIVKHKGGGHVRTREQSRRMGTPLSLRIFYLF